MEELEPKEGISRRKMMKRIGAGAASSEARRVGKRSRSRGFAKTYKTACDPGQTCANACDVAKNCHGNVTCNCWQLNDGSGCACLFFVQSCGDFGFCPCGPGLTCVNTCCGPTCTPACGTNAKARATGGA